jgi:hypothetical protein
MRTAERPLRSRSTGRFGSRVAIGTTVKPTFDPRSVDKRRCPSVDRRIPATQPRLPSRPYRPRRRWSGSVPLVGSVNSALCRIPAGREISQLFHGLGSLAIFLTALPARSGRSSAAVMSVYQARAVDGPEGPTIQ